MLPEVRVGIAAVIRSGCVGDPQGTTIAPEVLWRR